LFVTAADVTIASVMWSHPCVMHELIVLVDVHISSSILTAVAFLIGGIVLS